jgi:hypothetical protein
VAAHLQIWTSNQWTPDLYTSGRAKCICITLQNKELNLIRAADKVFLKLTSTQSVEYIGTFTRMLQSNLKVAKKSLSTNGKLASCLISNL